MWKQKLKEMLPLLGHRNWILVVDKAFPLQSAAGMTFIDTGRELQEVLAHVISEVNGSEHVKPVIYTDLELRFMDDGLCPGVEALRSDIYSLTSSAAEDSSVQEIPHDDIFAKLDAASELFGVVVLKTEAVMPYTSVFIELDCGYWDGEREKELRRRLSAA